MSLAERSHGHNSVQFGAVLIEFLLGVECSPPITLKNKERKIGERTWHFTCGVKYSLSFIFDSGADDYKSSLMDVSALQLCLPMLEWHLIVGRNLGCKGI